MKYSKEVMAQNQEVFTVKPYSVKEPKRYLGTDKNKIYYSDRSYGQKMGAETYVTHAIKNLKNCMATKGFEYNKNLYDVNYYPQQPFSNIHYRPQMDVTDKCFDSQIQFFHNLIVIMRWTVELGRIDISYEIYVLSRYLAQPSTGHLVQALHIFKYLDQHKKNELAFDLAYHNVKYPEVFQD